MTDRSDHRSREGVVAQAPAAVFTFLAGRVPGRGRALAVYVVLSLVAALITVTTLLALITWLLAGAVQPLDDGILHWVAGRQSLAGTKVALDVTALGNTLTLAVILACAGVFLWLDGRPLHVVVLLVGGVTGRLATELLKALFDRPRPDILEWGTHVTSAALPSAHAASATMAYGAIAYLAASRAGARTGRALWAAAGLLVVSVAASRVYLGVHYPTDVIAGIGVGAVWMTFALSALPACVGRPAGANIPGRSTRRRG